MNNLKTLNDEQLDAVQGGIKIADPKDGPLGFIGGKNIILIGGMQKEDLIGGKKEGSPKFTATDDLAKAKNGFYEAWPAV